MIPQQYVGMCGHVCDMYCMNVCTIYSISTRVGVQLTIGIYLNSDLRKNSNNTGYKK